MFDFDLADNDIVLERQGVDEVGDGGGLGDVLGDHIGGTDDVVDPELPEQGDVFRVVDRAEHFADLKTAFGKLADGQVVRVAVGQGHQDVKPLNVCVMQDVKFAGAAVENRDFVG